jgi:NADH dehydrogenase
MGHMTRSEPAWHPTGAKPAGAWNPAVGSVLDPPPVPRVVVIGSGFGGLTATKALAKAPVAVTLYSRTTHHLFQPLLYQVATGILSEGEIAPPTRDILKHQRNVEVLLGEITDIDLTARTVTAQTGELTTVADYDYLIVATGADQSYFGHPEFAADAPGLKSIENALDIRARLFNAFEMAELEQDRQRRQAWLTFVIVGAGATGVEMAGQISELSRRTLRNNFRRIDPENAQIILVDGGSAVLSAFGDHLSDKAYAKLGRLGVDVKLDTMVTDLDDQSVTLKDSLGPHRVDTRSVIWAAGVSASPLMKQLAEQTGAVVQRSGQLAVNPDCTLPGHPEVFVIGDTMALDKLPGVAQVAIQSGKYAAGQIIGAVHGAPGAKPFHYFDKGSMATISRFSAVASVGKLRIDGFIAWLMWLVIHIFYLVGFKNRVQTLFHWIVSFLGRSRTQRTGVRQRQPAPARRS